MTGRDLIIYILTNNLENEPVVDERCRLLGFLTIDEYASRKAVGVATVRTWVELDMLDYVKIGNVIYIPDYIKNNEMEESDE